MGEEAALNRAAFVDPEALVQFLDALRRAGYGISTNHFIAAQDVILALASQGAGAGDSERVMRLLRPLLCANPREQDEFAAHFEQWKGQLLPHGASTPPPPPDPPVDDENDRRNSGTLKRRIDEFRRHAGAVRFAVWSTAGVLVIGLLALYFQLRPTEGTLAVHSAPDRALVRISSDTSGKADSVGVTPLQLLIAPGSYQLHVSAQGHHDTVIAVTVKPRTPLERDVTLRPLAFGKFWIATRPGNASVMLDGQFIGRTPATLTGGLNRSKVPEGAHELRIVADSFQEVVQTLTVHADRVDSITSTLERASARTRDTTRRVASDRLRSLNVVSVPEGATVFVDGANVGKTPFSTPVTSSAHAVRLELPDYEPYETTVPARDSAANVRSLLARVHHVLRGVAFTGNGQQVMAGSPGKRSRMWNVADRVLVDSSTRDSAAAFARDTVYSQDRARFAVTGLGPRVVLRSLVDSQATETLEPQAGHVSSIAFSRDGRYMASGDAAGGLRLWSLVPQAIHVIATQADTTGFLVRGPRQADTLRVSSGGNLLAVSSVLDGVRLFDAVSGSLVNQFMTPHAFPSLVSISPLARTVVASRPEVNTVRVWNGDTLTASAWTGGRESAPVDVRLPLTIKSVLAVDRPVPSIITMSDDDTVRVWRGRESLSARRPSWKLPHPLNVVYVGASVIGDIVTLTADGTARIWRSEFSPPVVLPPMVGACYWMSLQGNFVAMPQFRDIRACFDQNSCGPGGGMSGGGCYKWASSAAAPAQAWNLDSATTTAIAPSDSLLASFNPDATQLLVRAGSAVQLWEVSSGALQMRLLAMQNVLAAGVGVTRSTFILGNNRAEVWQHSPGPAAFRDTMLLAETLSLADDLTLSVTRVDPSRSAAQAPRFLPDSLWSSLQRVVFAPDGENFALMMKNGDVVLVQRSLRHALLLPRAGPLSFLAFTGDGKRLLRASRDSVWVFGTNGTTELADLKAHTGEVHGLAFSPDGDRLASAGDDGAIVLWNTRTRTAMKTLRTDSTSTTRAIEGVAFSPDGDLLASVDSTGAVRLWSTRTSRWLTIAKSVWPIALAIVVLFLAWRLLRWLWQRQALALVRRSSNEPPRIERISLRAVEASLFSGVPLLRIATRLRRRTEISSRELDVGGTVSRSIGNGGAFTPVFRRLQVTPEYLALVDRASIGDQQAALVNELLDRLRADEVHITCYHFDGDPRVSFPAAGDGKPATLPALAQRFPAHRLLLFADARQLFNPITGELDAWTEDLAQWPERALLTPEEPARWGMAESLVARSLPVYHAGAGGVAELAAGPVPGAKNNDATLTTGGPFPRQLQQRPGRWIERDAPRTEDVDEMFEQLRAYLDAPGMRWLAACAVYPALHWKLTLNLGHEVKWDDGNPLLDATRLLQMSRLPWFRHGYMPDWLRLRLIDALTPHEESRIRKTLEAMLLSVVTGNTVAFDLEVARGHSRTVHALITWVLRRNAGATGHNEPLRDYVFLEFMHSSRNRLAFRITRGLRNLFARQSTEPVRASMRARATYLTNVVLLVGSLAIAFQTLYPRMAGQLERLWQTIDATPLEARLLGTQPLGIVPAASARVPDIMPENVPPSVRPGFLERRGAPPRDANLQSLHPAAADRVRRFLAAAAQSGIRLSVYETFRTVALQKYYYSLGRTVIPPSEPVTNASVPYYSSHYCRIAVDVVPVTNGAPNWAVSDATWQMIGQIGKEVGLYWGGDYASPDLPHFEDRHAIQSPCIQSGQSIRVDPLKMDSVIRADSPTAPDNTVNEIMVLVNALSQVIGSRDLGALERNWPGLTSAKREEFKRLFAFTQSLRVTLSLTGLRVDSAGGTGRLIGAYDFVPTGGSPQHVPVSIDAAFARREGRWSIVGLR